MHRNIASLVALIGVMVSCGNPTVNGGVPIGVTGSGTIVVAGDKTPHDMKVLKALMLETTQPELGKVYVWWMRTPSGNFKNFGVLPYEDVPYKANFEANKVTPDNGQSPFAANFNGAFITYEDETGADKLEVPVGPVVYSGEIPTPVWEHVNHVLTAYDGRPGLMQQAVMIVVKIKSEISEAKAALKAKNPEKARIHIENVHTLLVGDENAKDLTGDGEFATELVQFPEGLVLKDSAFFHAVKHAQFAEAAAKGLGGESMATLETAVLTMTAKMTAFSESLTLTVDEIDTFAGSGGGNFADMEAAVKKLVAEVLEAADASIALYTITLTANDVAN